MKPYMKVVEYIFKIGDTPYAITGHNGSDWVSIEEVLKNGQEDTHFYGEANLVEGKWALDKDACEQLRMYEYESTPREIEAYLDKHGRPDEE